MDVRTPAGLDLGQVGVYDVDLARLDKVISRIVKGLYFHENRGRLPNGFRVAAFSEDGLRDIDEETRENLKNNLLSPLMANEPKQVGERVFEYRSALAADYPGASVWLMTVYEKVSFIALTMPKQSE